jgi:general secretion pathway protein G
MKTTSLPYAVPRRTPFPRHRLRLILLVTILLATLAAAFLPAILSRPQRGSGDPISPGITALANLKTAIDAFEVDNGRYPTTAEFPAALRFAPPATPNWHGPYIERAGAIDPWSRPFRFAAPGLHNPTGFDLQSAGPDGLFNTPDDRTNWH